MIGSTRPVTALGMPSHTRTPRLLATDKFQEQSIVAVTPQQRDKPPLIRIALLPSRCPIGNMSAHSRQLSFVSLYSLLSAL